MVAMSASRRTHAIDERVAALRLPQSTPVHIMSQFGPHTAHPLQLIYSLFATDGSCVHGSYLISTTLYRKSHARSFLALPASRQGARLCYPDVRPTTSVNSHLRPGCRLHRQSRNTTDFPHGPLLPCGACDDVKRKEKTVRTKSSTDGTAG